MEIQSTSEITPYFTMTKIINCLYIPYSLNCTLTKSSIENFNHFNHFNDGSLDYDIQKAVTKTIRMLSV